MPRYLPALAIFACALAALHAQDVTVQPPALFDLPGADTTPDTPPALRKKWKPDYPDQLLKGDEPGYVIITQYITDEGKRLHLTANGSNVYFEQSVLDAYSDLQNTPPKKNGRPVGGHSWLAVIYNPAGAPEKKPDAAPRILKVAPIFATGKQLNAFPKGPKMIRGTLDIDTAGAPKNLRLETNAPLAQGLIPAIEASLPQWRFAPARKDRQPVEGTLTFGFVFQAAPNPKAKVKDNSTRPEPLRRTAPEYPFDMKTSGLVGEVTIQFIVDTDGSVTVPSVIRSNNPGFEQAAIDAILQWKFKPATIDGKPVKTQLQIPITFKLDGRTTGTAYAAKNPTRKQTAMMPEGYRYDTAPTPRGVIYPVYPYEQLRDSKEGKAVVGVLVNSRGNVTLMKVLEESAPEFGLAAVAACEYFEFTPALLEGKPTDGIVTIKLEFNRNVRGTTDEDRDMVRLEKKSPDKIIGATKLDATPRLTVSREAPFPLSAQNAGLTSGEAVVEFLIDTGGAVRLPRIVSSTHPSFGYIAVQTVANWRFEPPKANGKPAVTRARIPVKFTLKDEKPSA